MVAAPVVTYLEELGSYVASSDAAAAAAGAGAAAAGAAAPPAAPSPRLQVAAPPPAPLAALQRSLSRGMGLSRSSSSSSSSSSINNASRRPLGMLAGGSFNARALDARDPTLPPMAVKAASAFLTLRARHPDAGGSIVGSNDREALEEGFLLACLRGDGAYAGQMLEALGGRTTCMQAAMLAAASRGHTVRICHMWHGVYMA